MLEVICFDPITCRYFYSDIYKVRTAIDKLYEALLETGSVSLNDYCKALGLEEVCWGDHVHIVGEDIKKLYTLTYHLENICNKAKKRP